MKINLILGKPINNLIMSSLITKIISPLGYSTYTLMTMITWGSVQNLVYDEVRLQINEATLWEI